MAYGFIYYLSNPSMPKLTKIGMTTRHPRQRMEELTAATACPTPFEMLAFFDVTDARYAEQYIHRELDEFRVNDDREFFKVPMRVLQSLAREWIDTGEGCANTFRLDCVAAEELFDDIGEWMEAR